MGILIVRHGRSTALHPIKRELEHRVRLIQRPEARVLRIQRSDCDDQQLEGLSSILLWLLLHLLELLTSLCLFFWSLLRTIAGKVDILLGHFIGVGVGALLHFRHLNEFMQI